jgi:hypothetical protein
MRGAGLCSHLSRLWFPTVLMGAQSPTRHLSDGSPPPRWRVPAFPLPDWSSQLARWVPRTRALGAVPRPDSGLLSSQAAYGRRTQRASLAPPLAVRRPRHTQGLFPSPGACSAPCPISRSGLVQSPRVGPSGVRLLGTRPVRTPFRGRSRAALLARRVARPPARVSLGSDSATLLTRLATPPAPGLVVTPPRSGRFVVTAPVLRWCRLYRRLAALATPRLSWSPGSPGRSPGWPLVSLRPVGRAGLKHASRGWQLSNCQAADCSGRAGKGL